MKKILLLGENSYIATSFAQYAQGRFSMQKISCRDDAWRSVDFGGYDSVLCCVGIAHQPKGRVDDAAYEAINCDLCVQLAKKAKEAQVPQFIFLSTASVYPNNAVDVTQRTSPAPANAYGRSKLRAEQELRALADDAFKLCIARPPMVYGPDCKGNFPRLVDLAQKTPIFPKYQNKRSMIYIENLCEFLSQAVEQHLDGLYLPQNSSYVSTLSIVRFVAGATEHPLRLTPMFNFCIRLLQRRLSPLSKLFGDFTYRHTLAEADYNVVSFQESLKKSIRLQ